MGLISDEQVNHYNNYTLVKLSQARAKVNATAARRETNKKESESKGKALFPSLREIKRIRAELGPGPARFLPTQPERSIQEQLSSLSLEDRDCLDILKAKWLKRGLELRNRKNGQKSMMPLNLSDAWFLRIARNNTGDDGQFNVQQSWAALKKLNARYLTFKVDDLEDQLMTKTIFPLPSVRTQRQYGGGGVFYMRPSRYFAKTTSTAQIIDNLAYCIQSMLEHNEHDCTRGISFIARMNGWTMKNFATDYCFQFMQMLQGNTVPVTVNLFLIVNPPHWFGSVWKMMKPMLSSEFQAKVKMIPESKLEMYLEPGYAALLPNDVANEDSCINAIGEADEDELVKDWIQYRKFVEAKIEECESSSQNCSFSYSHNQTLSWDDVSVSSSASSSTTEHEKYAIPGKTFPSTTNTIVEEEDDDDLISL